MLVSYLCGLRRLRPLAFRARLPFLHTTAFPSQLCLRDLSGGGGGEDDFTLLRLLSEHKLPQARDLLERMQPKPTHVATWTAALTRYARRGFIEESRQLFDLMPQRNVVTWNAMLSAYIRSGRIREAVRLFDEMPIRNVVSYTCMLCGLARQGRIEEAKRLFDAMPERNAVSWNSMLAALVKNNELEEAELLFKRMPEKNVVSCNVMISGYAEKLRMGEARRLFEAAVGIANVISWTSLIAGYCRIGEVEEAYDLFLKMPDRNTVSWTAMIGGFTWNGFYGEALQLFLDMKEMDEVKPNEETLISLFYACAGLGFARLGKQLHGYLTVNELDPSKQYGKLSRSLVQMYSQCGVMDSAKYLFDKFLPEFDTGLLNSMINGYINNGELEKACHFFKTAPVRDEISWTTIISGYFNEGKVRDAILLFDKMRRRDAVSWTATMTGLIHNELLIEAVELFSEMQLSGVEPVSATFSTLLGAAGALACLELGEQFHCLVSKTWSLSDVILGNALISMYAKCGDIHGAHKLFDAMITHDVISWNSMILGLSNHGLTYQALELFDLMKSTGTRPNSVTFLSLLSSCSHSGLIDHAWQLFNSMVNVYMIQPNMEHYICMVDLLGRAGKISDAEEFIVKLPCEPGQAIWGALLGMCSIGLKDLATGRCLAQRVLELDPLNAPAHVLLCNVYAASGRHWEEEMVRKDMAVKGVRKLPGRSWIFSKGKVHTFSAGDESHPLSNEIRSLLAEFQRCMREA